ncbi:hypothetical protein BgiMline_000315 [Biomphalaria glabrata]|uniref:Uncharacterized protein LOC106063278 n=1 Tax=Biomphalaria glabrata TaxID=6526 RepID=A0A2C9LLV6_BIOGL|nr:uncharacterized protein LOC106063278 [Biomphalaria glabrata]XP_013077048.1 uncharacterized protein LOC106063278 [Biomphalaria glabrata]XP_055874090.1 uncharacterized protein LOC106063278 [Biomphalaria glabrata]KAI8768269.1 hypothetical protein BgiMline_000292 [Biomphalaria glabrata]
MDFSSLFSSLKKQLSAQPSPNVTIVREKVQHLQSPGQISEVKCPGDTDEGYLLVNEELDLVELPHISSVSQSPPEVIPEALTVQETHIPNQRNAISDVPFHLHQSLLTQQKINKLFSSTDLTYKQFDWSKYSVNFYNEEAVISGFTQQ